jgi:glycosyltransferase involved in cell wall biosynthesis
MARVLLTGFCAVPGPRRAGVQLRHVIRALTAFHSVDLLVLREGDQGYVERQGSVRVLRVPTHESDVRAQIQSFQRALRRQLEGADYDIVHCRDAWSGLQVLEARSRFDYAVVYDLARSPVGEMPLEPELDAQYGRDEEACILASDLVLAPTPRAVAALEGRGKPDRVFLSPLGVDIDRFDWDAPSKSATPRIVYAGAIDPSRGLRVLLRAMASIVRETDAQLVLAGPVVSAAYEQQLRGVIRELDLVDKVEIVRAVDHDELPALIASATVCVIPSASDLTPNPCAVYPTKLLEYMACKRAVVAPRRETISMIVDNGREALLFEPGDPVDLARKVLRLLGEPALRDQVAEAGYECVRRDYSASSARRQLRAAYTALAARFGGQLATSVATPGDEGPKVEMLADDDFEATVFEEAPQRPTTDTALSRIPSADHIEDTGASLSHAVASLVEEAEAEANDGASAEGDESTPLEGVRPLVSSDASFVAGEIDVPTPPSQPALEPDTGTRTPALERRS